MGTAAGVGMGSVIGHGVSNALFGGSGSGHVQEAAPAPQEQQQSAFQQEQPTQCSIQAKGALVYQSDRLFHDSPS